MFDSLLPLPTSGRITLIPNSTNQMNTTFVSSARAFTLIDSKKHFALRGSYVLQGEPHPESGAAFHFPFFVDKEGFAKINGVPFRRSSLPTPREILSHALKALNELEGRSCRLFCDDQDERFLASVGAISRASCDA